MRLLMLASGIVALNFINYNHLEKEAMHSLLCFGDRSFTLGHVKPSRKEKTFYPAS